MKPREFLPDKFKPYHRKIHCSHAGVNMNSSLGKFSTSNGTISQWNSRPRERIVFIGMIGIKEDQLTSVEEPDVDPYGLFILRKKKICSIRNFERQALF